MYQEQRKMYFTIKLWIYCGHYSSLIASLRANCILKSPFKIIDNLKVLQQIHYQRHYYIPKIKINK